MAPRTSSVLIATLVLACSGGASTPSPSPSPAPAPSPSPAPSPAPAPAPSTTPAPSPSGARPSWLYEVTSEGARSYVFAMLEPGCPLEESFPAEYEVLFRSARTVVVPVAWTEAEERDLMMTEGLSADSPLAADLGPERLARFLELTSMPPEIGTRLVPFVAVAVLTQVIEAEVFGAPPSDVRLSPVHDAMTRRWTEGLPVVGMLTSAEGRQSYARMGAAPASDALRAYVDHEADLRAQLTARLSAYRAGDEADVARRDARTTLAGAGPFEAAVRAENLQALALGVARIEGELRTGDALVLMPAGQVVGDGGLLARLRADRFSVTRLSAVAPAD